MSNEIVATEVIAAIATPQTPGGIGIVRVSGLYAQKVAERVFASAHGKSLSQQPGYTCLFGHVHDDGGVLDECVAINYRAPKSYTGENTVELCCHGGPFLLRRCLAALLAAGARLAGPGEFTRRAFLNGKLGLTQAESVMGLISAKGEQAARAALAGHGGALQRRISALRAKLADAAAHLAAWADYPDDDIPQVNISLLKTTLTELADDLSLLLDGFENGRALREGVDTVIAGRPNAGKSTLMNLLSGCERSIVTEHAGTTRDVVEETILLSGIPLRLADTAGLRFTDDPIESAGVERARARLQSAQLILAVFDSSVPLNSEDYALAETARGVPCVAVVNKSDLESRIDLEYIKSKFKHVVYISAAAGEGLPALHAEVKAVLCAEQLDPAEGQLFTERQRAAAAAAKVSVQEAHRALCAGVTLDAVTVEVEAALSALLELTGERVTDAVVDEVFAKFCVGK